ncbi:MAG: peptide deformylase [bacterium]
MIKITQNGDPVLRKIAKEVPIASIGKDKIHKVIADMKKALHSQDDGVAIAAPQIGVSLRIFVVSGKVFEEDFIRGSRVLEEITVKHPDLVFINPIFKKMSRDKKALSEGCLSVRPIYGKVRRATKATIEAINEHDKKFTRDGTGLLAQIFQHETDHLDGILFIDKAKDMHESTSEEEFR